MRKKRILIFSLCLSILLSFVFVPVPAFAASNSKISKKKVVVTYKKVTRGILVICNNKNKATISIKETVKFLDSDKQTLSSETQKNLCLKGKNTATFFFATPRDSDGNTINYTSFTGRYSIGKSKYTSRKSDIKINSELDVTEGRFVAVNTGKTTLSSIYATFVFYDASGSILGCYTKYINCFKPKDIDQFSIGYIDEFLHPDKVKVYINWAY